MRRLVVLFLISLIAGVGASSASAAGTVTVTASDVGRGHTKYTVAWVSDASGDVNGNSDEFLIIKGSLRQASFAPDSGGTQPDDLYDATFTFNGVDVLDGVAANLSDTTSVIIMFDPLLFYDGTSNFDLVIANAGNANGGTFILWMAP